MKKTTLIAALLLISLISYGQVKNNVFTTFAGFKTQSPSLNISFKLRQRTGFDIFMTGGIGNHRIKSVSPSSEKEKMTETVWGVMYEDSVYINSYPYSGIKGYNKIIGTGYYTYFIGEPAKTKEMQQKLGIISGEEVQRMVWGKTAYVILPDGTVKWLNNELLKTLVADNPELKRLMDTKYFMQDKVCEMFDVLERYNKAKQ